MVDPGNELKDIQPSIILFEPKLSLLNFVARGVFRGVGLRGLIPFR